ncbi:MAG: TetR/AcrR family transcriptional regulator [Solobacterium sp.]|nr:TetR/AcrR family transcriptional regulator [Solobacterium sp.]MBR3343327.1 TetR/AcrR family transcriptional regulator [Solobacterium sp.]
MAKKAIKKFKTAFSELLGKSPYDELTIVQVADAAKVTRQSFYYHYESMDDFVFDIISDGLDDAINKDRRKNISLETIFVRILTACRTNRNEALNLYNSSLRDRLVVFCKSYFAKIVDEMIDGLLEKNPRELDDGDRKFIVDQYSNGLTYNAMNYIADGMKEKPADVGRMIAKFLGRTLDEVLTAFAAEPKHN